MSDPTPAAGQLWTTTTGCLILLIDGHTALSNVILSVGSTSGCTMGNFEGDDLVAFVERGEYVGELSVFTSKLHEELSK